MNVVLEAAAGSAIFTQTAAPYLLLDSDLTIRASNAAYLAATERSADDTLGLPMFEAFPDNPEDPEADGVRNLSASLQRVLTARRAHEMQVQRYDVRPTGSAGEFRRKYWAPINTPLLDESGHVSAILHHVEDLSTPVALLGLDQPGSEGPSHQIRPLALGARRLWTTAAALDRRSGRLDDALTALVAARGATDTAVGIARRAQLWRLVAEHVDDSPWAGWASAVCQSAVEILDTVDAAALSLTRDSGGLQLLTATSPWAAELHALELSAQGPATTAAATGLPVIADPLTDEHTRWPTYVAAASSAHLDSVAAYPLALSHQPLGVLALYRRAREVRPTRSEHADAAVLAELALTGIVADYHKIGEMLDPQPSERDITLLRRTVRVLARGRGISQDEALARIQLHALHTGRTVTETARDVILRTGQLE